MRSIDETKTYYMIFLFIWRHAYFTIITSVTRFFDVIRTSCKNRVTFDLRHI